jgi:hypothetical protein
VEKKRHSSLKTTPGVPKITEEEAVVLIRRDWMTSEGTLVALNRSSRG